MPRARMTLTATIEYEMVAEHYESNDPQLMADEDSKVATEDPFLFLDCDEAVWNVDVEVLQ